MKCWPTCAEVWELTRVMMAIAFRRPAMAKQKFSS
jgi:hypothetical protein